jgi:hypothetical protein
MRTMPPFPRFLLLILVLTPFLASPALPQEAADPTGEWAVRGEGVTVQLLLGADGRFVRTVAGPDGADRQQGTWTLEPGTIIVRVDGVPEAVRVPYRMPDFATLELESDGAAGTWVRLSRVGAPPIPPAGEGPAADLARLVPSPAGRILYVRGERMRIDLPGIPPTVVPVEKIWVMTGDGQTPAPFISPAGFDYASQPKWGPDGRTVWFASNHNHMASCNAADVFVADLATGQSLRLTGCWRSVGPVKGFGSLKVSVMAGGIGKDPVTNTWSAKENLVGVEPGRVVISYLGMLERPRMLHEFARHSMIGDDFGGQHDLGMHEGVLRNVPAGRIWVKAYGATAVGDVCFVDVPPGGQAEARLTLSAGNTLLADPVPLPDGRRFLASTWRNSTWRDEDIHPDTRVRFESYRISAMTSVKLYDSATGFEVGGWDAARETAGQCSNPDLSPDGRLVALQTGMPFMEGIALCTLENLARGNPRPVMLATGVSKADLNTATLLRYGYGNPAWSPDSRRIAFVQSVADTSANVTGNLFIANADGTGAVQVTNLPANMLPGRPSWSPDGTRIAFDISTSRGGAPINPTAGTNANLELYTTDVYTIALDGTDLRRLTNDGISGSPCWGR